MGNNYNRKIENLFGHYSLNSLDNFASKLKLLDKNIGDIYNFNYPYFKGDYNINFYEYLKNCKLQEIGLDDDETMKYLSKMFQNVPNWKNPGTMINIIPPVNLDALAASTLSSMYNSNFAQDTYAGYLIVSELEVVKYISDLIKWNWNKSGGFFTFGGKGTNLYASKIALNKADPNVLKDGLNGEYFIISTKTSHPCHYQVCDWIGIGYKSAIEIDCNLNGEINTEKMISVIKENLNAGKKFLGVNLNGGNTNELVIDPIKKVKDIVMDIKNEYELDYIPHIHVDSVIGWVYLFYNSYDFKNNPLKIDNNILRKIKLINKKTKQFKYADSLGIDFHKVGFCPYVSSLFMVKNRNDFNLISKKEMPSIKDLKYGNYDPYDFTLELSRSSTGAVSALTSLKSLGIEGFQYILATLLTSTTRFKNIIKKHQNIFLLNENSQGFATLFLLLPDNICIKHFDDIKALSQKQVSFIKQYNIDFSNYLLEKCLKNEITFYFTSSRSYTVPGTNIAIGAMKSYPTSVFLDNEQIDVLAKSLFECILKYSLLKNKKYKISCVRDDMVYKEEK